MSKQKEKHMSYFQHMQNKIDDMIDEDPNLRQDFINEPKKFIKDNFRIEISDEVTLKVVLDEKNLWHYIVPPEDEDNGVGYY